MWHEHFAGRFWACLAPVLGELVATLRRCGELVIDDKVAALLMGMPAATIARRPSGASISSRAVAALSLERCW